MDTSHPIADAEPVGWPDAVKFIRQLSHDLRNHLNAAELEITLMNEMTDDAELKQEIKRLREVLGAMTAMLQKVSSAVVAPRAMPIDYKAADLLADIRSKFESDFPERAAKVQWTIEMANESTRVHLDPQLIQQALCELLDNACRFEAESINVNTRVDGNHLIVAVHEKRNPPAELDQTKWGREPLRRLSHGHYSLGLNRVRMIAEANGGEFRAHVDRERGELVSTIVLPLTAPGT